MKPGNNQMSNLTFFLILILPVYVNCLKNLTISGHNSDDSDDIKGRSGWTVVGEGRLLCSISTLCEYDSSLHPDYPTQVMTNLIKETGDTHKGFFQNDLVIPDPYGRKYYLGEDGLFENLDECETRRLSMFPKVGLNDEEEWYWIVNLPGYTQEVYVEMCIRDLYKDDGRRPEPCNSKLSFPEDAPRGGCEFNTQLRKLVAMDKFAQGISIQNIYVPVCCQCRYQFDSFNFTAHGRDIQYLPTDF